MGEAYLWHGGRVFTGRRWCDALLVESGRVVFAGSSDGARRVRPRGSETIDLHGRLLLPGLIDAHVHLADLTRAREGLDLREVRSIPELRDRLAAWARRAAVGAIVGRGWDQERFAERRWPTLRDIDTVVDGRPVILYHTSGHAAVVNGAALDASGIDRRAPDPPDGKFGRGPDGSLNGLLYEGAMRRVSGLASAAAPPTAEGLARTLEFARSLGLTTVATMNTSLEELGALRALASAGPPRMHIRSYLRLSALGEFAPSAVDSASPEAPVRVVGVKGFTDGAFGPRTAWLSSPYADGPEGSGLPIGSEEEFRAELDRAAEHDLAPALHAIGDRALSRALRVLEGRRGRTTAPPRVEHAALTPPELLPEIDRARPVMVVQPGFLYSDWWLSDRLGAERARWAYSFRTLLHRGHVLAGSSDAPYDPLDPWRGMQAAIGRIDPEGRSANPSPEETLTAEEAVQLYTVGGGSALGDDRLGTLEEGSRADLVVLGVGDLRKAIDAGAVTIQETWVDGQRVFRRPSQGGTVKP
jgi:predicted amidohydrolase YtcJ